MAGSLVNENQNPEISQTVRPEVKGVPAVVMPSSSGNWWKIGILIVGLLLTGSIVYAGYQFSQKQTAPPALPTPMVQSNPTPIPDPTANWKTYKNEKYNFEFRYPNFLFFEDDNSVSNDIVTLVSVDPEKLPARGYIPTVDKNIYRINLEKIQPTTSFNTLKELEALEQKDNGTQGYWMGDAIGTVVVTDTKEIKTKYMIYYQQKGYNSNYPDFASIEAYVFISPNNALKFSLSLDILNGQATFDQILSTFKFLE